MELTKHEFIRVLDALLNSFTTDTLTRLVQNRFGLKLSSIAGEGSLVGVAFNLISWSETNNQVDELLSAAAAASNPPDADLAAIRADVMRRGVAPVAIISMTQLKLECLLERREAIVKDFRDTNQEILQERSEVEVNKLLRLQEAQERNINQIDAEIFKLRTPAAI